MVKGVSKESYYKQLILLQNYITAREGCAVQSAGASYNYVPPYSNGVGSEE